MSNYGIFLFQKLIATEPIKAKLSDTFVLYNNCICKGNWITDMKCRAGKKKKKRKIKMVFPKFAFKVRKPLQLACAKKGLNSFVFFLSKPLYGKLANSTLVHCHQFSKFCEIQCKTSLLSWTCTWNYHMYFTTWIINNYASNFICVWRIRTSKVLWLVIQVLTESSIKLVSEEREFFFFFFALRPTLSKSDFSKAISFQNR